MSNIHAGFLQRDSDIKVNMKLSQSKAQKIAQKIADDYMKEIDGRKEIKVRINNIEFRTTGRNRGEIIKWYPNNYYGKLEQYLNDGWEDVGPGIMSKGEDHYGCTISKDCFKNKESCFVVAWVQFDESNDCCDMTTVGPRVIELDKEERDTFFEVYELADKKLTQRGKDNGKE
jgi:hypothetical protein